jgi:hypothetical protein
MGHAELTNGCAGIGRSVAPHLARAGGEVIGRSGGLRAAWGVQSVDLEGP